MKQLATYPIEIIIACHTPERRVERAVESVVVGNGELASATIVCHNVDRSAIEKRIPEVIRGKVKFLELHDGIPSPAGPFTFGLEQATAPWVGIMGSDDYFEPGALAEMLALSEGHDAVMPRVRHDEGGVMRTPPVRLLSRRTRDAVRDRLYYRSAPIGLIRRKFLAAHELRLEAGLTVGEDLRMSTLMWTLGKVAVQRSGPSYVVGSDANDRVTMSLPRVSEELRHIDSVWNDASLQPLSARQRAALGTKYLRIHIFGTAYYRAQGHAWQQGDREALAAAASRVLQAVPEAADPLSRADRDLLDAILDLSTSDARVGHLARARRRFGRPETLLTRSAKHLLHREAPLRFMAASVLVR